MTRHVALIRGVGGPTAMKMPELRAALQRAGLGEVSTLQVAGNIVFDTGVRTPDECGRLIRASVLAEFGHDLPVIVRSHEQLADAHRRNPFVGTQEGRWVATMFCEQEPGSAPEHDIEYFGADSYAIDGHEIFLRYDGGVGNSRLQPGWFERKLGIIGTARNANTVAKLIELTAADAVTPG